MALARLGLGQLAFPRNALMHFLYALDAIFEFAVEACLPKAVSAEGKKLSGAAKNSFMRKCARNA